ncbi:hypothetical protein diail_8791 [Diaporthe ilicicola]|nr:hypothetical protein diail_8791 [Diaporthe ilicicola]
MIIPGSPIHDRSSCRSHLHLLLSGFPLLALDPCWPADATHKKDPVTGVHPRAWRSLAQGLTSCPEIHSLPKSVTFEGRLTSGLFQSVPITPRFMYSRVHASPYNAVEIFQDTKCRKAMAMHWGTFALTSEPVEEPPIKLRKALEIKELAQAGLFDVCAVGEGRKV